MEKERVCQTSVHSGHSPIFVRKMTRLPVPSRHVNGQGSVSGVGLRVAALGVQALESGTSFLGSALQSGCAARSSAINQYAFDTKDLYIIPVKKREGPGG
jgi:hypothetical protein